jgi:predicted NBD/HSP70 family sugar kinase
MSNPLSVQPKIVPKLDPHFLPAVLEQRAFREMARSAGAAVTLRLALEQADGSVFHHETVLLPAAHPKAKAENFRHVERMVKFLLWARGGFRIYVDGPAGLVEELKNYYQVSPTGRFDSEIIGERICGHPIEVVHATELPAEKSVTAPLGRHWNGCRIGFDLGGSDRKVAAVIDGKCVFSEEIVWDPYFQPDPQYHFDGVMDSLKRAAVHLPRVDGIGGSSAGVYVNNLVKVASLFRGVPKDLFDSRVKDIFLNLRQEWNNIPFDVVNDGDVTALAASMSLDVNSVLGVAMGTSTAAGYVNHEGNITSWLNELAFTPEDYRVDGPVDEWSGDVGCGVQFFSQQGVGRLLKPAEIDTPEDMPLPEKLKHVQALMEQGDVRARAIYETIGVCFGYAIAHYTEFYDFENVLVLGRVTSGAGGEVILDKANEVLKTEFPTLGERMKFHVPDEKDKRHGQAVAAASLPVIV